MGKLFKTSGWWIVGWQSGSEAGLRDGPKNQKTKKQFHKSWAHGAKHRDSSIKVRCEAQIAPYASKKLLKSWT